jgi:hypothetical protein
MDAPPRHREDAYLLRSVGEVAAPLVARLTQGAEVVALVAAAGGPRDDVVELEPQLVDHRDVDAAELARVVVAKQHGFADGPTNRLPLPGADNWPTLAIRRVDEVYPLLDGE